MSSYGSGFAEGMQSGSAFASNMINAIQGMQKYKQQKKLFEQEQEDAAQKNQLFKAYVDIAAKKEALNQQSENNQRLFNDFQNASVSDISKFIIDKYIANGNKVDNRTYTLATGIAQGLFDINKQFKETEEKRKLADLQMQRIEKEIKAPYTHTGQLAADANMPLTEENIKNNPTLFGRIQTTPKIIEFEYAQQHPAYANYIKEQQKQLQKQLQKPAAEKPYRPLSNLGSILNDAAHYPEGSENRNLLIQAAKNIAQGKNTNKTDEIAAFLGLDDKTKTTKFFEDDNKYYISVNGIPVEILKK